jgi:hypothetical protein
VASVAYRGGSGVALTGSDVAYFSGHAPDDPTAGRFRPGNRPSWLASPAGRQQASALQGRMLRLLGEHTLDMLPGPATLRQVNSRARIEGEAVVDVDAAPFFLPIELSR